MLTNRINQQAHPRQVEFFLTYLKQFDDRLGPEHSEGLEVLVFNERNPIARLFTRLVSEYDCIEDGEANYIERQLPWLKRQLRRRQGLPEERFFGENPRCRYNYVLEPGRVPDYVRHKTKKIDFLNIDLHKRTLLDFYRIDIDFNFDTKSVVLITQPFENITKCTKNQRIKVFEVIADELHRQGYEVILKTHPRESLNDYANIRRITALDGKTPMEVIMLGSPKRLTLFSVMSSAGMGFEDYCYRLKMIDKDFQGAINLWGDNMSAWRNAVEVTLSNNGPAHP